MISASRYLYDFGQLGDIVSGFEARNIERASRSNAKTGLSSRLYGLENGVFARDVLQKWPLGFILGSAWTSWGHSWPSWAILGPPWRHLGQSWGHLGAILGDLRVSSGDLGDLLRVLGAILGLSWPTWGHLGYTWAHLGSVLDGLGAILGPSRGYLGLS